MIDENKYYTPTIDEFHVGFEYEIKDLSKKQEGWDKIKITNLEQLLDCPSGLSLEGHIEADFVRVKYLDKEDIEFLGWIADEFKENKWFWKTMYKNQTLCLLINVNINNLNEIYICNDELYEDFSTYYNGVIKNKSELKKLMQQLNIK